jgi:hypothetical protein
VERLPINRMNFGLLFILLVIAANSHGQAFYRYQYHTPWSISFHFGVTQYFGDMYSFWKYQDQPQLNPNIYLTLRRTLTPNIKARFDLGHYQISGNDKFANPKSNRIERNLHFQSENLEVSAIGEYYLNSIKEYNIARNNLNIYTLAGIGFTSNDPKTELDHQWISLRPLTLENQPYNKWALIFPFGLGLKYKLRMFADLQFEVIYRWSATDYLDDVSIFNIEPVYKEMITQYTDSFDENHQPERLRLLVRNLNYLLPNGQPDVSKILASQGRIRRGSGLDNKKDGYLSINLGIEIYLSRDFWDHSILKKKRDKNFMDYW